MNNLDQAKVKAIKENKLILLNFSGSDWCIPCISMHRDIFDNDMFISYANQNLILVNADYPRKKKNQLSVEQQKVNDAIAEKYNPEGSFPLTILMDGNGKKLKVWEGYYKKGAESFIDEIRSYIK